MTAVVKTLKKDTNETEKSVVVPLADIYETEKEYVIKAEMPGVEKDGVEITLNNQELEI